MSERRAPAISVILPVRNAGRTLPRVLAAIRGSTFRDYEVVAVDDGSSDESGGILGADGVDVLLRHDRRRGQWPSRNAAVAAATGRILFFVDSDVEIGPDTLERVHAFFAADGNGGPESARRALIGVYSHRHPNREWCSRYKNAWIRYSYLRAASDRVDWFFTGVGALPRAIFAETGGFTETFRVETGGGDVEFGRRLRDLGVEIFLDRSLEAVHLKRFSLLRLLQNDLRRAYGWSRLALRRGDRVTRLTRRGLANVTGGFVAGVALTWLTVAAALVGPVAEVPAAVAVPLTGWAALNARFWTWLARRESVSFALTTVPLMFLDQLACGLGVAGAILRSNASLAVGRGRRVRSS